MGFIIRGFIWDIPILIFAYVLLGGPTIGLSPEDLLQLGIRACMLRSQYGDKVYLWYARMCIDRYAYIHTHKQRDRESERDRERESKRVRE